MTSLLISLRLNTLQKYNEQQVYTNSERRRFIDQARYDQKNGCIELHIISISSEGQVTISPAGAAT